MKWWIEPRGFADAGDGRVAVTVHQLVRALDATVLADRDITHVYSFRDGLIAHGHHRLSGVGPPSSHATTSPRVSSKPRAGS